VPKLKVYVETSVVSGLTDDDPPERRATAKALFSSVAEGRRFAAYISSLVVEEIMRGPEDLVQEFDALMRQLEFNFLEPTAEAEDLADRYILEGVISEHHRNDAMHLAIATVAELDVVLSWNLDHMVNLRRIRRANGVNLLQGYGRIDVRLPEEVLDEAEQIR
jgi:predicted nucleic acid-binding protein